MSLYISAWASALLVQTLEGNAKALMRGTSNRYRFPRFFIYRYYNSDLTHKNRPVRESAEGHWLTRQAASTLCGFPSSIC